MDTITSYIAKLPETRRERAEAINRLVVKLFSKAEFDFRYQMPTYRVGGHFFA